MQQDTTSRHLAAIHCMKFAVVLLATSACKPSGGGDMALSSLDHFVDTAPRGARNECGPSRRDDPEKFATAVAQNEAFVAAPTPALRQALAASLAAVPEPLRAALTGPALLGKFVADNAAVNKYCSNAFDSETERTWFMEHDRTVKACWKKEEGRGLVVFFSEDEGVIRHTMVRAATYVYTQLIEKNYVLLINQRPQSEKDALLNEHMRVLADRAQLGDKLLADLQAQGLTNQYQRLIGLYSDQDAFSNYVFAEAVDSYYCSRKAHSTFSNQFSFTFESFTMGQDSVANQLGATWFQ